MTTENKILSLSIAKTTSIVGFIITFTWWIANTNSNINFRIEKIETKQIQIEQHFLEEKELYEGFSQKIENVEKQINSNNIDMAEIKASLKGIETTQQDILSRLKK